jgi:UDP-N-acetylmuramoyl-L-alanyl-D-glutamate--2,6-diaminopimelate ligase
MTLSSLLEGVEYTSLRGPANLRIEFVTHNSQDVKKGSLFVAIRGGRKDGHDFVASAIERGATAVVVETNSAIPQKTTGDCAVVLVRDTKEALAKITANFWGDPTSRMTLVGVTGTNGKTTTTYLLESIWREQGRKPGVIGTVERRFAGRTLPSELTTPESTRLMETLHEMESAGTDCVAMEVSSHALSQKRVSGCHFDAAIFTNLSQDHLDYHGTMENYFIDKARLFTEVLERSTKGEKFSIINTDDEWGRRLTSIAKGDIISYSLSGKDSDVYCGVASLDAGGIKALALTPWGEVKIKSRLAGKHNLSNILAALSAALALGAKTADAERGIEQVEGIPGRLERVKNALGIEVFVDYAHTPDALGKVLQSVRALTKGRLILVFGCGGDRDRTKRPIMGKLGRELSDVLILTSDNPRTEDPRVILDQIEGGVLSASTHDRPYYRIEDRREAIRWAIELAAPGDIVLIAGKGHEDYQIIGTTKFPFDDRAVARECLEKRGDARA